jgi:2,4-didehydro-3-deoxy-L-rhamnonate hydrolase
MATLCEVTGLKIGTFGFGTFTLDRGKPFPGLVKPEGEVLDMSYADTHVLMEDWDRAFELMSTLAARSSGPFLKFSELNYRQPLAHPNLLCAGANYKQHVAEMLTKNKFNQHNRLSGESDEAFFKRNYMLIEKRSREGMPFFGLAYIPR